MVNKTKDNKIPKRLDYVEIMKIDRSTLYSFDWPFQLIHVDVANLKFLGKLATIPRYALLIVDLYSSEVYVYPMRSKKTNIATVKNVYEEINNKERVKTCTCK